MLNEALRVFRYKSRLILSGFVFMLLLFVCCRALFFLYYRAEFSSITLADAARIFFFGCYFDLSALALLNILYVLMLCLPLSIRYKRWQNIMAGILFSTMNISAIALNLFDTEFFSFTHKRLTVDIVNFGGKNESFLRLVPGFIKDYWLLVLLFVLFSWVIVSFTRKRIVAKAFAPRTTTGSWLTGSIIALLVWVTFSITAFRGWFVLIPIDIVDAGKFVSPNYIPLVLNTPFTFAKSIGQPTLPESRFMPDEEAARIFDPIQKPTATKPFEKKNVVFIIVEGLSKEFVGTLTANTTFTPFLDSLSKHSLLFTDAYANGKQSIQGIPSILASIPSLMNGYFTNSSYASDNYKGLGTLLKEEGYQTAFFHGASRGSFNFDAFAKQAGYDRYFSREDFNNEKEYDGNWGIWDEPFLQYTANTISTFTQPFHAAVFTVTSHGPFVIPAKYKSRFKGNNNALSKCIQYTDYSIGRFFGNVKTKDWYRNSVFVIVADHAGISETPFFSNYVGQHQIPILFFDPSGEIAPSRNNSTIAQNDIVPTLLPLLNYDKPFFSLGNDAIQKSSYGIFFTNQQYQVIQNYHVLSFDGQKSVSLYNFKNDSLLANNILHSKEDAVSKKMELQLKAYLQQYTSRIRNNKLLP